MPSATKVLTRTTTAVAIAVGIYAVIIGSLLTPPLQRIALYAHKFNTLYFDDLDNAERFGFAKGQVTPFNIQTPDGQTLYAWHILPVDTYLRNEAELLSYERPSGPVENFTESLPFRLLTERNRAARVVVNFHGNAGHIAQGWRTDTYRNLATQPNTHVVTIDYRGFGHSTGSPTEAGLIVDGTALVNWVLHTAKVSPERIIIVGQSLGTAVSSAVALNFADPSSNLIPHEAPEATADQAMASIKSDVSTPTAFAGVILVAPFSSVPSLLITYRMGGLVPILLPLRPFPAFASYLTSNMIDKWPTALRLAAYSSALARQPKLLQSTHDDLTGDAIRTSREMGAIQIVHARSDRDIAYHQTEMICLQVLGERGGCVEGIEGKGANEGTRVVDVKEAGRPRFRFEIRDHGGHNRVITYSPVSIAVLRAFEGAF